MVKVFAPGVVKLFGEHAVVYGKPAIATTIDRGVFIECEKSDRLIIESIGTPSTLVYLPEEGRLEALGAERFFAYVNTALKIARERWGKLKARFSIKSELPPSIGAATSAAVSVGILKAYSLCANVEVSKEELAKLGHQVELNVQGIASPMDTTAVAIGGVLKIWAHPFRVEKLDVSLPQFYIVVLPRRGTTGEIVADVKALLDRRRSAQSIINAIGEVVEEAEGCLRRGDLNCVGELMILNNWLLGALGVVDNRVMTLLDLLKTFVYGGKISGAGRGGVVLILPKDETVVEKILSATSYTYFKVSISKTGVVAI